MKANLITKLYGPKPTGYGIEADELVKKVIAEFENSDYDAYFKKSRVKPSGQKENVAGFQNDLLGRLNTKVNPKYRSAL